MALRALTAKNGFSFPDSQIIYCGIDYDRFYTPVHARNQTKPLQMVFAGRLHPDKGIETACKAAMRCPANSVQFDIYGDGDAEYVAHLHATYGDCPHIHFRGKVAGHELAEIYPRYDVLIFPSEWEEPFALTPLEAAAAGIAIIGTTTGGSGEFLCHEKTALPIPPVMRASCTIAFCISPAANPCAKTWP